MSEPTPTLKRPKITSMADGMAQRLENIYNRIVATVATALAQTPWREPGNLATVEECYKSMCVHTFEAAGAEIWALHMMGVAFRPGHVLWDGLAAVVGIKAGSPWALCLVIVGTKEEARADGAHVKQSISLAVVPSNLETPMEKLMAVVLDLDHDGVVLTPSEFALSW